MSPSKIAKTDPTKAVQTTEMDEWKTLEAVGNCVIVKEVEKQSASEGGILLPSASQEQPPEGVVLGIGPLAKEEWHEEEFLLGDRVIFLQHAGAKVYTAAEGIVKVMRVSDVIAVRRR